MFGGYSWEACSSLLIEIEKEWIWGRDEVEQGSRRSKGKGGTTVLGMYASQKKLTKIF